MSVFKKSISLIAVALISAAGCDLCAQTPVDGGFVFPAAQEGVAPKAAFRASASTDTMRLGYCVDEPRLPGLMLQDDGLPHAVGAAIELDANLLDKYVGDQIEAVEFAIDPARGFSCQVFVCTDLKQMQGSLGGGSILSSVTLSSGQYHSGWNHVKLSKPVTIKEGGIIREGYHAGLDEFRATRVPTTSCSSTRAPTPWARKTGMETTARGSTTLWASTATSACVPSSRATPSPRTIFL